MKQTVECFAIVPPHGVDQTEYAFIELCEALLLILCTVIYTILFPFMPFIRAFCSWRKAIRDVKRQAKQRNITF